MEIRALTPAEQKYRSVAHDCQKAPVSVCRTEISADGRLKYGAAFRCAKD